MLDHKTFPFCSEFYVVEKTIEVVVDLNGEEESSTIRIEALHSLSNSNIGYCTRAYIQEYVTAQPTYPQRNEKFVKKPEDMMVWKRFDLPWTSGDSADEVLATALGFLGERCQRESAVSG
jgi:hypothetical protein